MQLVRLARHLGEGDGQLLVGVDGDGVALAVRPGEAEVRVLELREQHPELLHQEVVVGPGVPLNEEPSHLKLAPSSLELNFKGELVLLLHT